VNINYVMYLLQLYVIHSTAHETYTEVNLRYYLSKSTYKRNACSW